MTQRTYFAEMRILELELGIGRKTDRSEFSAWSIFSQCPDKSWENQVVVQNLWGWPVPCMHSRLWATPARASTAMRYKPLPNFGEDDLTHQTNAIFLREDQCGDDTAHIPTGMIPLAFAANSLIYACGFWLLAVGARWARSAVRRRRGRCPHCGHHQDPAAQHERCPECGKTNA